MTEILNNTLNGLHKLTATSVNYISDKSSSLLKSGKTKFNQINTSTNQFCSSKLHTITKQFTKIKDSCLPGFAKGWWERHITPLDKKDAIILATGLIAAVITSIMLATLGIAGLPIIMWTAPIYIFGSITITSCRLKYRFDLEAASKLNTLNTQLMETNGKQELANMFAEGLTFFKDPKYEHRKEIWTELNAAVEKFNDTDFGDGNDLIEKSKNTLFLKINGWITLLGGKATAKPAPQNDQNDLTDDPTNPIIDIEQITS